MTLGFPSLPRELQDHTISFCDADSRSSVGETSKEFYQRINNGEVWQSLHLGDFVRGDEFWTMREIFSLNPQISKEIMDAAMVLLANTFVHKYESGRDVDATTGEWRILLELLKRDTSFPNEAELNGFQSLVEKGARDKGASDIFVVLHQKKLLSGNKTGFGVFNGIMCAAEHGHDESLKVMLRDFPHAKSYRYEFDAFNAAVKYGQLNTLKVLRDPEYAEHTSRYRDQEALKQAAENGHLPVVLYLLENQKDDFSGSALCDAINKAKQCGHIKVFEAMFQNYIDQADEYPRIIALEIALEDKKIELAKEMLQNPKATSWTWGVAFTKAVELGLTEIVEYIYPYTCFPYLDSYVSGKDYRRAIEVAEKKRDRTMIELLTRESHLLSTVMVVSICAIVVIGKLRK